MNREVVPEDKQLLIAGYVLGDLSQEEGQQLEQLLAADPHLQTDLAQLQATVEVAYGAESSPPAHLKSSILAAVNQPAQQNDRTLSSPTRRQSSRRLTPSRPPSRPQWAMSWAMSGLGVAAALLAVTLGVQNYTLRQALRARPPAPVAQSTPEPLTFTLEATDNSQSGEVVLVVNPDQLSAELNAQGLPPLAADKVYALWTVVEENTPATTDQKNAILTAVFTVDEAGRQSEQITVPSVFGDQSSLKAVAVTIEDAAAPQQHQSAPLLIQRL